MKKTGVFILLALLFTSGTCLLFLPVIGFFTTKLHGFPGDPFFSTWFTWWFDYSRAHGIEWRLPSLLAHPYGLDYRSSPLYIARTYSLWAVTRVLGEIGAYNLLVFLSFPLAGLTMYLLAYRVTRNRYAAALSGVMYAFCPYHIAHSYQHLSLADIQWFPLYLYGLFRLYEKIDLRGILVTAAAFFLIFCADFYYVYFALFMTAVFVMFDAVKNGVPAAARRGAAIGCALLLAGAAILPVNISVLRGMFGGGQGGGVVDSRFQRSLLDLTVFSAKPLDYLLPSKYHPVLGRFVPNMGIGPWKGHRFAEHTLYAGVVPVALACIMIVALIRRGVIVSRRTRFFFSFAAVLAVCAGLCSLPPVIPLGGYTIDAAAREIRAAHMAYMPSYYLYKLVPFFRCYARFGILVMLGVAILAAGGFAQLVGRLRGGLPRTAATALTVMAVFFEFLTVPPVRAVDSSAVPPAYLWLKGQAGGAAIAEYPLGDGVDPYTVQEYQFWQRVHGRKMVNGAVPGTPAYGFHDRVVDITAPGVVGELRDAGVGFVVVHEGKYRSGNDYLQLDWVTALPRDKRFSPCYMNGKAPRLGKEHGVTQVRRFGDTVIYRVDR
ncbi:MAG TPA: hypothetical protein P5287_04220 [bacterium]|nr:hypothetical protein [bacterium]